MSREVMQQALLNLIENLRSNAVQDPALLTEAADMLEAMRAVGIRQEHEIMRLEALAAPAAQAQAPQPVDVLAHIQGIEAAIDRILAVVNQRREPGWSYRNTITTNRAVIRAECASIRAMLAAAPTPPQAPQAEPTDAQMLDWLEQKAPGIVGITRYSGKGQPRIVLEVDDLTAGTGPTLRAAIRAAMAKEQQR